MVDESTVQFVSDCVRITLEDPNMTGWQKFKFICWLFVVTAPAPPKLPF